MTSAVIPETVRKLLASQPIELPIFHPVAIKLQRMLSDYDFTVDEVANVAIEDQSLATQMLKMANSPMYMGRTKVATIKEAVIRLGAQQVINLAIAASQAAMHTSHNEVLDRYMKQLWLHSHGSALGARWLAHDCGMRGVADETYLAALLHDVGKSEGNKGHHKTSFELIRSHSNPLGWKPEYLQRAAIIARFHGGTLPTRSHKALRDLLPDEQRITIQLAAILRLANAFDAAHDGHISRVKIENTSTGKSRTNGFLRKPAKMPPNQALVIEAEGFVAGSATAQAVAAERYLLETVLRRPVVVKAMKSAGPQRVAVEPKLALRSPKILSGSERLA